MNAHANTFSWSKWIEENIGRGCTTESMIHEMMVKDFTRSEASGMIEAVRKKKIISSPSQFTSRVKEGPILYDGSRAMRVCMRLASPHITVLENVMSPEECDQLVAMSEPSLKRSTTVDNKTGGRSVIRDRTSDGMSWARDSHAFINQLDERFSRLMGWPIEHGEGLQVARYQEGGQYTPHYDYFPPEHPGSHVAMERGGQRVSTLLLYLNTPDEGGETAFPRIDLKIHAHKGMGVIFEYTTEDGAIDPKSLHAGLPVLRGEKWIATRWMRLQPI